MHPPATIDNPISIFTGILASDVLNFLPKTVPALNQPPPYTPGADLSKPSTPLDSRPPRAPRQPLSWTSDPSSDKSNARRPSISAAAAAAGIASFWGTTPVKTPSVVAGKKRSFVRAKTPERSSISRDSNSEPVHKRRRIEHSSYTLDRVSFPRAAQLSNRAQPPSPLFFSNTRRPRPQLPARFSSSEAAARMLSKAQGEDNAIKIVTLPRGTFSGLSPPALSSGRTSERSSLPRTVSPEGREGERNDPFRLLASLGVAELLEHDNRPTLIVDTEDASNYTPGSTSLQILFANHALRSNSALWHLASGKLGESVTDNEAAHASVQFKGWMLTTATQADHPDANPSTIEHAGVIWSIYTLRRRLRIVSGILPYPVLSNIPSTAVSTHFAIPSLPAAPITGSNGNEKLIDGKQHHEPQDYFGDSTATIAELNENTLPLDLAGQDDPDDIDNPEDPMHSTGTIEQRIRPRLNMPPPKGYLPFTDERMLLARSGVADVDAFRRDASPPQEVETGFFDWTRLPLSTSLPSHIQFARAVDWANTALGPIECWGNDLRAMCNLIMASPHPAAMYWGDELIAIYNEAYIGLAGQKHPTLMGQSYMVAWAEIWDDVRDVFANARSTGQATMKDDDCLFMSRNGFLEETYFSWSIIPMVGEDGSVMGLYNPAFEKTRRKIAERRMLTLREVGERTAIARDVKGFWEQVLVALTENEFDTPFILLYSVSDDTDSDSSSLQSSSLLATKQCYLEGGLGVPPHHPAAPEQMDLKEGMEGFAPVFREVMKNGKPVVLGIGSGDLPLEMMEGLEWRGFGDACRDVIVCPIHPTTGDNILGFLILGINPRRPFDDDYNLFIQLLSRQLATSLASVVLFEEEIRRGQKAAKLAAEDRFNLSEQLAARTQEAMDSETRFTRMAEYSPAGLFIADHAGRITYCNDTWYEISRVPKEPKKTDRWIDFVKEEDQEIIQKQWKKLVDNAAAINIEFRFKTPWQDRNGTQGDTWVLFSAFPEKFQDGMLKSVFGSITNISSQKWAEGFQKRKMEEAIELKRQQENFIDMTSHEMRNPLSAILQCADEISTILGDFRSSGETTLPSNVVTDSIDAAQTIALCALHQKRIVDDVLTLSKLDSAMLMVTPVDSQPLQVVQRALKMFEGEVQSANIQMDFVQSESFTRLNIDWVKLDPSRVLQVLINLTTNAIKFTSTTETSRTIKVILSASLERPSSVQSPTVSFFPARSKRVDQTLGPDWGDGEEIFLEFAVQDTGRGLSGDEKKLLFQRFSQASPRTHVQYGGSGLGLFISRELTELQGGEIGVSSEAGRGSTFAFYVKCRRSIEPQEPIESNVTTSLARHSPHVTAPVEVEAPKVKDFAVVAKETAKTRVKAQRAHLKVLIVEDNLVNQKVLQRQLNNHGITTYVANHGGEALERLKESQYWQDNGPDALNLNVVLMDKEMPIMDGLTCTNRIRELEKGGLLKGHVPIIGVTANARSEQIVTLLSVGMDDVVSKPFRIGELVPKIEELAARYPYPAKTASSQNLVPPTLEVPMRLSPLPLRADGDEQSLMWPRRV